MSLPRQGSQKTLEIPKFEFASWISWVSGCACQGRLGGCPPPKCFTGCYYGTAYDSDSCSDESSIDLSPDDEREWDEDEW